MTDTVAGPLPPFIPELRQAIRENLKTQTRRVIKEPALDDATPTRYGKYTDTWGCFFKRSDTDALRFVACRYGEPGQVRYMREPIYRNEHNFAVFLDDGIPVRNKDGRMVPWRWKVNTLSGLFMPSEYARTFVKMERIHVERVQEISARDALAEGISDRVLMPADTDTGSALFHATAQRQIIDKFAFLWDKINFARGFPWQSNPPVWVMTFHALS